MIESFKLPNITPETLTGSIVSFNDEYGGLPLKSCTSLISGYQEGSGTPSPDNVRPLHAFSSATLTANSNTYTFTFGQTIYQGSIDWLRGVVVGTYNSVVYDGSQDEAWTINNSGTESFYYSISNSIVDSLGTSSNSICNAFIYETIGNTGNVVGFFITSGKVVRIRDSSEKTIGDWRNWLSNNNVMIVYPLATPIEIPLGGINLLTQEGQNNIFADCGDTEVQRLKVN